MFEYSVICILSAAFLFSCSFTTVAWSSPSFSKLNATDGPFDATLTIDEVSWLGSLPTLGCIIGPLLAGLQGAKLGRKTSILIYSLPITISYFIMAFAKTIWLFYLARFFLGLSFGTFMAITPIYVGEMSLNKQRGVLSGILGTIINFGLITTLALGPYVSVQLFNLILACFPLFFIVEFFIFGLESPHYLMQKGKYDKAQTTLRKMRKASDGEVDNEFQLIKLLTENKEKATVFDIFKSKGMKKALIITLSLFSLNQLAGIPTIQTYAQPIFEQAGSSIAPEICAIILGVVSLIASILSPLFLTSVGRKPLLIGSAVVTSIFELLLGIYFWLDSNGTDLASFRMAPLVLLMAIILSANVGLTVVPIVFLTEIFPNATKGIASNITVSWNFVVGFFVSKYFPILSATITPGPCFMLFSIFTFSVAIFTFFVAIETKDKNLKDILDELNS